MGAMAFLPAGYAIAGPVASVIGASTALWIGAAWLAVSLVGVLTVRDVRRYGADRSPAASAVAS
jgi:hypothetical protein